MKRKYEVDWTLEAKRQIDNILSFLRERWSESEAKDFLDLLLHFENTISQFPKSYKESSKFKECRLGLIHRHVTAIYKITGKTITILTVFDNRSDVKK